MLKSNHLRVLAQNLSSLPHRRARGSVYIGFSGVARDTVLSNNIIFDKGEDTVIAPKATEGPAGLKDDLSARRTLTSGNLFVIS